MSRIHTRGRTVGTAVSEGKKQMGKVIVMHAKILPKSRIGNIGYWQKGGAITCDTKAPFELFLLDLVIPIFSLMYV